MMHVLLLTTILSALCSSASFVFRPLSWLILPGATLFFIVIWQLSSVLRHTSFASLVGFLWGIVFFSIHCIWLFLLLRGHTTFYNAGLIYGFVIAYFAFFVSILFTICFFIGKKLQQASIARFFALGLSVTIICFAFQSYCWLIIGRWEGYPFVSPLIPLARIPGVLYLISCLATLWTPHHLVEKGNIQQLTKTLSYVSPKHMRNPVKSCQYLYHKLTLLPEKSSIVLAPESSCAFPLNQYPDQISLLQQGLRKGQIFLLGGYYSVKNTWYQVVYQITSESVIVVHTKEHTVFLVEKMPHVLRKSRWFKRLFLENKHEFTPGPRMLGKTQKVAALGDKWYASLTLCSELFFCRTIKDFLRYSQNSFRLGTVHIFLMNDSWFCGYFNDIMKTVAQLTAALTRDPVVYVGHANCFLLYPEGMWTVVG